MNIHKTLIATRLQATSSLFAFFFALNGTVSCYILAFKPILSMITKAIAKSEKGSIKH